jgi:hypothetical protein
MARRVFYSFHYKPDNWRAAQVRSAGVIEGNAPVSDNDWEAVTRGGDEAIQRWINGQLDGKSCAVVLIGSGTAGRKWINYEIIKAWNDKKGVLGVHIHGLKDSSGNQSIKGGNPFDHITLGQGPLARTLSSVAKVYDPVGLTSTSIYDYIKTNLAAWVDTANAIRNNN